jgi:hypothetical protein
MNSSVVAGLSLGLLATGFVLGKVAAENNNKNIVSTPVVDSVKVNTISTISTIVDDIALDATNSMGKNNIKNS